MNNTTQRVNSFVHNVEHAERLQKQLVSRFPEYDIAVLGAPETTGIEITVYRRASERKLASTHVFQEDFVALPNATFDGVLQTVETLVSSSDLTLE